MGTQKKHGKGRLDKWYKLAKEKGYRARAAFKLIQLNKKYGFLEKSKVLLDLCAAPGSWCQVAAETMSVNSLIVGVDLSPIKPIPRVTTLQSDITTDKCRAAIRQQFKSWKADTVLHDGAPNVGTAWVQDSFNQAELALQAMKLATEFLVDGGTFVTKVFRSKDYNSLLWVFNQLFTKVEATKPPSSRNVSAEIFVVCRGFKAPKRMDPKFLDPRFVFAELPDAAPNNEAKIFKPEIKKRKRDGYEEGNYTQFKEAPVSDFVQTTDPIAMLGSLNRFYFTQPPSGDVALAALDKLPETTKEIRDCCTDLRVLGRKEFKSLLRWRLKVRERLGFTSKIAVPDVGYSEEVVKVEQMDEELQIQEELLALNEKEASRRKRERRRKNEKKQKENIRMQLHMTVPNEIGLEQVGPDRLDTMFALKIPHNPGAQNNFLRGNMEGTAARIDHHDGGQSSAEATDESDIEEDRLDCYLDLMYKQYQERRSNADTKFRANEVRKEYGDGDWEGFPADEHRGDERDRLESDDGDQPSDDEAQGHRSLPSVLNPWGKGPNELSKRATQFFKRDIFQTMSGLAIDKSDMVISNDRTIKMTSRKLDSSVDPHHDGNIREDTSTPLVRKLNDTAVSDASDDSFEVVKHGRPETQWEDYSDPRDDVNIITAEAMTLAQQIASGEITSHELVDDGFNKHAFKDQNGLPDWFLDDEQRHDKPHKTITATGAAAIKEKLRALNARPIKKVREAKERRKFKAARRLEKMRKKSALLNDEEGMSEKEKAQSIAKLMSKAARRKPKREVKVIVARGSNRGIAGRPRGVKGRYKIVDARLKKDIRAGKRLLRKK